MLGQVADPRKPQGCCRHRLTGVYRTPSEPTIRRVTQAVDVDAAHALVGAWLREEAAAAAIAATAQGGTAGQEVVAVDGKTVRNTLGPATRTPAR